MKEVTVTVRHGKLSSCVVVVVVFVFVVVVVRVVMCKCFCKLTRMKHFQ